MPLFGCGAPLRALPCVHAVPAFGETDARGPVEALHGVTMGVQPIAHSEDEADPVAISDGRIEYERDRIPADLQQVHAGEFLGCADRNQVLQRFERNSERRGIEPQALQVERGLHRELPENRRRAVRGDGIRADQMCLH